MSFAFQAAVVLCLLSLAASATFAAVVACLIYQKVCDPMPSQALLDLSAAVDRITVAAGSAEATRAALAAARQTATEDAALAADLVAKLDGLSAGLTPAPEPAVVPAPVPTPEPAPAPPPA